MNDREIAHRGFHVEGSDELARYGPLEDEQLNESIRSRFGFADGGGTPSPELETCTRCHAPQREGALFCSQCSLSLSSEAAKKRENAIASVADDLADPGLSDAERRIARAVLAELQNDPRNL